MDTADLYFRYEGGGNLTGVIYFHRISDDRWGRSDTRSIGWLKRICGETALRSVVLVTNMWGDVTPETSDTRERQLATEFVKPVLDKGAQLHRHYDTTESAHQIIGVILNNHQTRTPLQIQRELVDERREFCRTTVGEEINREFGESTKKLEGDIEELQNTLKTVKGGEEQAKLQLEIAELRAMVEKLTNGAKNMNADYKRMKSEAGKQLALVLTSVGFSVSCVILGALYYYFFA